MRELEGERNAPSKKISVGDRKKHRDHIFAERKREEDLLETREGWTGIKGGIDCSVDGLGKWKKDRKETEKV